MYLYKRLRF